MLYTKNNKLYELKGNPKTLFKSATKHMMELGSQEQITAFTMSEYDGYEPRTFNKPRVKLIGQTRIEEESFEEAVSELGFEYILGGSEDSYYDAEEMSEIAGRVCYVSLRDEMQRPVTPGLTRNQTYLNHIKETKHGSVNEHSVFNFLVWDVSRNLTHELVRHRVGVAYSQLSTRYVDQFAKKYFGDTGHTVGTYVPPEAFDYPEIIEGFRDNLEHQIKLYYRFFHKLTKERGYEKKRARSVARHVLGGSSGTMLVFSVNARELNHIFDMRGSLFADDEIRRLTLELFRELSAENRALFNHWEVKRTDDDREYLAIREKAA